MVNDQAMVNDHANRSVSTFAITIAYDGTRYAGWQVQPGRRTIQGELEKVLTKIDPSSTRVLGSGRTDAGVHAVGQVARVVLPNWPASELALLRAINSKLPDDITVRQVRRARADFHPIADSVAKTYRYFVQPGGPRDVFDHRLVHRVSFELDVAAMRDAAARLVGTHDFAAFQAAGAPRTTTVRTIFHSRWSEPDEASPRRPGGGERVLMYEVRGNGFLYNMVRNLVGTMLDIGRGKQPPEWIDELIAARDRTRSGPTAPARGLFLWSVEYPAAILGNAASSD